MKIFLLFLLIVSPNIINAQRVQLSGIPGQDSDMDITDMLNQIMAPYHSEVTNLHNNLTDEEIKYELWQEFRSNVQNFEQVNRYIVGYESSFRSLTNYISDPTALVLQTSRVAKKGDYRISIDELASAHSFSSAPINNEEQLSGGDFSIVINTNTYPISFKKGNLESLYRSLSQSSATNNINFRLLNASTTEKILSFVSKEEGAQNKVSFLGDTTPLLESKILTKGEEQKTNIMWDNKQEVIITNKSISTELSYPIEMPTYMSFSASLKDIPTLPQEEKPEVISLSNLQVSNIQDINSFNIVLPGATPILEDVFEETNNTNAVEAPVQQIELAFDDNSKEIIIFDKETYTINLDKYKGKTLTNILAIAENKILDISEITLTASPDGDSRLFNETIKAQDASFILDGVAFRRPSNIISDIIPGVTLELQQEKKKNVSIQIKPDIELIKDTIVQWVVSYNTIMEEIFTFTTIPLSQIGKMKPLHQRQEDEEDLKEGTFYGNSTLISFKDRLRRMIGSVYNYTDTSITLLDQIGIYVRRRSEMNNDPDSLRKGTLSLNTTELEQALNENFEDVQSLFAVDTDNNSVGDKGVALSSLDVLQMMIGGNGYLTRMEQNYSRDVREMNERIAKKEDEVDRITSKERQALLQMNQAVMQSKALSESLKQRFSY